MASERYGSSPIRKPSRLKSATETFGKSTMWSAGYLGAMAVVKAIEGQSQTEWSLNLPFLHIDGNPLLPLVVAAAPIAFHTVNQFLLKPMDERKGTPVYDADMPQYRRAVFASSLVDAARYVAVGGLLFGEPSFLLAASLGVLSLGFKDKIVRDAHTAVREG